MTKLVFVVVVGVIASLAFELPSTAVPCRPDFPNCRRPHPPPPPPPPPQPTPTIYQRVVPVPPPAGVDRETTVRLLAGSAWMRLGSREQIRFVDPSTAGHFAHPPTRDRSSRTVPIDLRRDRRMIVVALDGALYTVAACQAPRSGVRPVVTTCLVERTGGGFGGQGYGGATYGGR